MKLVTEFLRAVLQIPFLILMGITLLLVLGLFSFFDWLFNEELDNAHRHSF